MLPQAYVPDPPFSAARDPTRVTQPEATLPLLRSRRHAEADRIVDRGPSQLRRAGGIAGAVAPIERVGEHSTGDRVAWKVADRQLGDDGLSGTVRDNLTYLSPDAPDGDVAEAAFVTGMQPIVDRIGGLDVELSAGELQLIALARAWLSPARIVILDEATCHLDATSEATVETAFRRRGGTLIVIAHRLGSALRADRVLVMDGERTVVGTHDELLGTSPLYAELVAAWEGTGPALT